MPGFNGTGPAGAGPLTGRGRGYCGTRFGKGDASRYRQGQRGQGRGFRGRNRQACFRGAYGWQGEPYQTGGAQFDESSRLNWLQRQADSLKQALDRTLQRIRDLEEGNRDPSSENR